MNVLKCFRVMLPGLAGLMALGAAPIVWGQGCIQGPSGTANPILFAKGAQSCATISGYTGCSVTKGTGTCDIVDAQGHLLSTVTSTIEANGSITWSSSGPAKIFAAGLNGAQSGNACVYFYPNGEGSTQSGIGYNSSTSNTSPTYTNIQEAFYCTDLNAQVVTTESDIKACTQANGATLPGADCSGQKDGTIISVWTPTYDTNGEVTGSTLGQCYCNDGNDVQGSYACNLSGVDDGDPNTLEDCFTSKPLGDPTLVQFFPDATSCSTKLGSTKCSCIDNPFTPTCNECTGAGC